MDGWKHATVIELQGVQIRVRCKVWSWTEHSEREIDNFYDVSLARPLPPKIRDEKITFSLHQEVEVYDSHFGACGGFWCRGEVVEVRRNMSDACFYSISLLKQGIINVKKTDLRVFREWVDGQWVQPRSDLHVEQPLKQRKALAIGSEVEVNSLFYRGWIPVTILGSAGNLIVAEARMRKDDETKIWRLSLDVSRMRPRPFVEKDDNCIFNENEVVEVFESNGCWQKGEIWEVHGTKKSLFYSIKAMREDCIKLYTVSKSDVRVRRKWVGDNWSDSYFEQRSSSLSSPELIRDGALDERRSTVRMAVKQRKLKCAQFCIGAEVEVFNNSMGGWEPGTIVDLKGIEIGIEVDRKGVRRQQVSDASLVRPKPPVIKVGKCQIFRLNDEVEALVDMHWCVGQILEGLGRGRTLLYCVSHPRKGCCCVSKEDIRVHQEWRDGKWIRSHTDSSVQQLLKETNMDKTQLRMGAKVEVYSFMSHGWLSANILQLWKSHIEVITLVNNERWNMYVDSSRIRPPPPLEVPNDHIFNLGGLIEVCSGVYKAWQKGEIWGNPTKLKPVFYSILDSDGIIVTVSKSQMRVRQKWVQGKWILPSFGTSLPPEYVHQMSIHNVDAEQFQSSEKLHEGEAQASESPTEALFESTCRKTVTKAVEEQHDLAFPTAEAGISNADMDVHVPSSINPKPTRYKDITWNYCQILANPSGKGRVLKCKFCGQIGGGIYRMKAHLGHQEKGDAIPCPKVPPSIRDQLQCHQRKVTKEEKVKRGHASKEKQSKHTETISSGKQLAQDDTPASCQELEEDEFDDTIGDTVKEGNTRAGPTGTEAHCRLLDGQENLDIDVEGVPTSQPSTKHITDMALQGYTLSGDFKRMFELIYARHGDIFRNCIVVGTNSRFLWTYELCEVVQQMEAITYETVCKEMIDKWYAICMDHKMVKIDNEWLLDRIGELSNIVKARMDASELKSSLEKINEEIKMIDVEYKQMMWKRRKLIEEVESVRTKMKTAIEKSKVPCPSQSLINGLY